MSDQKPSAIDVLAEALEEAGVPLETVRFGGRGLLMDSKEQGGEMVIGRHVPGGASEYVDIDDNGAGLTLDLEDVLRTGNKTRMFARITSYDDCRGDEESDHRLFEAIRSRPFELVIRFTD